MTQILHSLSHEFDYFHSTNLWKKIRKPTLRNGVPECEVGGAKYKELKDIVDEGFKDVYDTFMIVAD